MSDEPATRGGRATGAAGGERPAVSGSTSAETATAALRATCWGTRGSIPSPGPDTARYGGNTACLEVRNAAGRCFILDGGTGIRALGDRLKRTDGSVHVDLFFTHFHWDHIQGIPFFAPLYDPGATIRIHGPRQDDAEIEKLFARQLESVFFPIPYDALAARLEFSHLGDGPWRADDVEIEAMRVRHPSTTVGYRVRVGDAVLAYVPDNELVGGSYPVDPDWYDRFLAFLDGVDLLFHDAMLTEAELPAREGWGHSTFRQTIRLARDAGVRRLRCFHHAPDRTDDELTRIVEMLREEADSVAGGGGAGPQIGIATEGETLEVEA
ncbi:MAG: MBL fold metallo-hydrolase [Gemmatimonadota bacterium]